MEEKKHPIGHHARSPDGGRHKTLNGDTHGIPAPRFENERRDAPLLQTWYDGRRTGGVAMQSDKRGLGFVGEAVTYAAARPWCDVKTNTGGARRNFQ
jgi:hypothetical protein